MLKCLTTKLVECFFGHITESVQGNNLLFLERARHLRNVAFSFLLLYVNTEDNDVSIRSEKDWNVETFLYLHDALEIDHIQSLQSFLCIEHENMKTFLSLSKSEFLHV